MKVKKGKKEFNATVKIIRTHTSVSIRKEFDIEENELWYSNEEFNRKGIEKVLKENGYKLISK
jgi:hypothetical protein